MRLADENGKHRDRELDIEKDGMEGPDVEVARPLAENIRKRSGINLHHDPRPVFGPA